MTTAIQIENQLALVAFRPEGLPDTKHVDSQLAAGE